MSFSTQRRTFADDQPPTQRPRADRRNRCALGDRARTARRSLARVASWALPLCACGGQDLTITDPTPLGAPAYEPVFESTDCWWTLPETQPVDCGYLVVPENRDNPRGPDVRIATAVLRHPGGNPESDPIIYLHGGPGGGPLPVMDLAWPDFTPFFETNRDVIVFDQRGVGLSEPALDCPEHAAALMDLFDRSVDGELVSTPEALTRITAQLRACGERLGRSLDLSAYDSAASAADVNDLRIALGYEAVNLYAESYGPRIAQVVMRDYPASIRSVVLDAPVAMSSAFEDGVAQFALALRDTFEECSADSACRAAYPDLRATWFGALERLEQDPVLLSVTNPRTREPFDYLLDDAGLSLLLWRFSYGSANVPAIPALIQSVAAGDYSMAERIVASLPGFLDLVTYGDYFNVTCREVSGLARESAFDRALEQYPEARVFAEENLLLPGRAIFQVCDTWGGGTVAAEEYEPVSSDIPSLLAIGDHDPSQGVEEAAAIAAGLSNGFGPYVFPGLGHVVFGGSPCSTQMINAFLERPTEAPDARCIEEMLLSYALPGAMESDVVLEPLDDDVLGFATRVPAGWSELAPGVHARGNPAVDPTILTQASAPSDEAAALVARILSDRGAGSLPSNPVRSIDTEFASWSLYLITGQVAVAAALAERGGTTYVVVLRGRAEEFDALAEGVLLPVVMAISAGE